MAKFESDNLHNWNEYRGMVRWLSPVVLLKTAKKVVDSTLFGQYADRRLIQAALDSPIRAITVLRESCGGRKGVLRKVDASEVWVDYVADLGDGFDSTYAIAYLIGRQNLRVDEKDLPRADCLIMGGDQVYPDASREEYSKRMLRPYRAAFPKSTKSGAVHPLLYLIPGNHDWYDGLSLFLANFCSGRKTLVGSWLAPQRRSYFAIRLFENWWIWGFDSQLGEDIDGPQAEYFETIAQKMGADAKIILCASVPTWLKADIAGDKKGQEEYYRALHYIANIAREKCSNAKIPLVIAGDLHHYSRYVAEPSGTTFVTAGGGGAFLHPTHHLSPSLSVVWPGDSGPKQTLNIAKDSADGKEAFYPPREASRRLSHGNLLFLLKNPEFCAVLGLLYWLFAFLMLLWNGYGEIGAHGNWLDYMFGQTSLLVPTPVFFLVLTLLGLILYRSAEIKVENPPRLNELINASKRKAFNKVWELRRARLGAFFSSRRMIAAALHTLAHILLLVFGTAAISILAFFTSEHFYFIVLLLGMFIVGFVGGGGVIWGVYLTVASWLGDESNAAFSALRLDSYRHFLRLKIEADRLTIYPIGLQKAPQRDGWQINPDFRETPESQKTDQDVPFIIPKNALGQKLIESEITIELNGIMPLKERSEPN